MSYLLKVNPAKHLCSLLPEIHIKYIIINLAKLHDDEVWIWCMAKLEVFHRRLKKKQTFYQDHLQDILRNTNYIVCWYKTLSSLSNSNYFLSSIIPYSLTLDHIPLSFIPYPHPFFLSPSTRNQGEGSCIIVIVIPRKSSVNS